MATCLNIAAGLFIGYVLGSFAESVLHEYISDAPKRYVAFWRRHPKLFRIPLNTYFSHHVIHHYRTFRRDHVTQFESEEERERLTKFLLGRGRHGRIIINGNYANHLHAEGALVFTLPAIVCFLILVPLAPLSMALAAAFSLSLPSLFSYFIHPYLHQKFEDGQKRANRFVAFLLRTRYMKAVYRNHFLHHRYGGVSNFNLVLGADLLRNKARRMTEDDIVAMKQVGMPID